MLKPPRATKRSPIRRLIQALVAAVLYLGGSALADDQAPAPQPAAPAADVGATATLREGVRLRKQPSAIGTAVPSEPGEVFVLKASVRNGDGTWWYVASTKVIGWALEPDLVVTP